MLLSRHSLCCFLHHPIPSHFSRPFHSCLCSSPPQCLASFHSLVSLWYIGDYGHEVAAYVQRQLPLLLSREGPLRKPALTGIYLRLYRENGSVF
jgi:hypothetical protein